MKKILVIGSKGMAGHVIFRYLHQTGRYQVFGMARNVEETDRIFSVDVSDTERIRKIIAENNFSAVINCIGILNKDAEDHPAKAIWFNSYFPHFLEEISRNTSTKLIHISTDCVFNGKKGGYTENDPKDGSGFYAQSKALGEVDNQKDLTIRTSIIGPELNKNGIGLFHWFMSQPMQVPLKGFSKAFWSGITTIELAKVIDEVLTSSNVSGIVQIAAKEKIDKHSLLGLFNEIFRENKITLTADDSYKVDKSLVSIRGDFIYNVPNYREMLQQMKTWIETSHLYRHYE